MKQGLMIVVLLWCQHAFAAPMTIDADRFAMIKAEKRADFFGHVVVRRDDVVIKADQARVWYQERDGKHVLKAVQADGHVRITTANKQGMANHAHFTAGSQLLVLRGQAKVVDERSTIEGHVIEYHMRTEQIRVRQNKSGERVKLTFEEEK